MNSVIDTRPVAARGDPVFAFPSRELSAVQEFDGKACHRIVIGRHSVDENGMPQVDIIQTGDWVSYRAPAVIRRGQLVVLAKTDYYGEEEIVWIACRYAKEAVKLATFVNAF